MLNYLKSKKIDLKCRNRIGVEIMNNKDSLVRKSEKREKNSKTQKIKDAETEKLLAGIRTMLNNNKNS